MNEMELRGEMVKRGYTAAKLAESIGIGEKAMSNKLTGKSDFKQSEIKKICSVLNLDNDQIIAIFFCRVSVIKDTKWKLRLNMERR